MKRKAFLLRIPPHVHDALAKWAEDELRSMNGHVEFLLTKALKDAKRYKSAKSNKTDQASGSES